MGGRRPEGAPRPIIAERLGARGESGGQPRGLPVPRAADELGSAAWREAGGGPASQWILRPSRGIFPRMPDPDLDMDPGLGFEMTADPYAALEQASMVVRFRALLFVLSLVFAGAMCWMVRDEVAFALFSPDEPALVGDVRALWLAGRTSLDAEHNSYVWVENLVPTRTVATEDHTYFLSPIYDILVRTPRPLPAPPQRLDSINVDPRMLGLVQERWAFPENLLVRFDVKGRLLRLDRAPRWTRRIRKAFHPYMKHPEHEAWLLIDGDEPGDALTYVWVYVGALVLLLLTGAYVLRSMRQRDAARASIVHG